MGTIEQRLGVQSSRTVILQVSKLNLNKTLGVGQALHGSHPRSAVINCLSLGSGNWETCVGNASQSDSSKNNGLDDELTGDLPITLTGHTTLNIRLPVRSAK